MSPTKLLLEFERMKQLVYILERQTESSKANLRAKKETEGIPFVSGQLSSELKLQQPLSRF